MKKLKNVVLILLVAMVLVGFYWHFSQRSSVPNEIETEVSSDPDEEETSTDEYAFYSDMISGTDMEALVLSINQQTEVIKRGDAAICAGLGILIGILFIQGFRLRRI